MQYRTLKTYHHGYNLAQSVRTCLVKPLSAVFRIFGGLRAPKSTSRVPLPLPARARSANMWHFLHYSFLVARLSILTT